MGTFIGQSETADRALDAPAATVLLVEDEDPLRNVIEATFQAKGFRVLSAASAEAAIQAVTQHGETLDILITDLSLPGMDGYSLARSLVNAGSVRRVVYMSGYSEDPQLISAVGGHVPAYIEKPFRLRSLLETVNQILRS